MVNDTYELELLKLPRKIDFYNYSACSGGSFFVQMVTKSCPITKKIIKNPNGYVTERNWKNDKGEYYAFKGDFEGDLNYGIIINPQPRRLGTSISVESIINLYKYSIINAMIRPEINLEEWSKSLLIFQGHWHLSYDEMRILSEYPYWDFIDLNPVSRLAWEVINRANEELYVTEPPVPNTTYDFLERFPFMDYILIEDYDSIKDWLSNRYGDNLDFHFIDESLRMWRSVRIEPFL